MKKLMTLICASLMAFSMAVPSFAAATPTAKPAATPTAKPAATPTATPTPSPTPNPFALPTQKSITDKIPKDAPKGQVIVGASAQLNADFIEGFSSSGANQNVRNLIDGWMGTVVFTKDEGYIVNPMVVKSWSSKVNADGTKTYTFEIYDNLVYNEGTKITAKDYLFTIMWYGSLAMQELNSQYYAGTNLVGFEDYAEGNTWTFTGLRLLSNYSFSATIAADQLPSFHELAGMVITPSPMHVIAPGCTLEDKGKGVSISDNFTTELLRSTIEGKNSDGYRYKPTVTAGPYKFVSYDPSKKLCIIEANDKFIGTYHGYKPRVKTLIFKDVAAATQMDELSTGSVNLLTGVSGGERIEKGLDLAEAGKVDYAEYPRAGYGKITLGCDFGPTQFVAVRQALAMCLDRNDFARQYTGGHGIVVNGYYGAAQWEYIKNKSELEKKLNAYTMNLEAAEKLLIEDGWTLNEKGGNFVKGTDKVRAKKVDGKIMPLILEWMATDTSPVSALIASKLPAEAAKIGFKINQTLAEFATVNDTLKRKDGEAKYHMFNLATGFSNSQPYWYMWGNDPDEDFGYYNMAYLDDAKLVELTQKMQATDQNDKEGWAKRWMDFQVRWNEVLPEIPLYSDEFFDFYSPDLKGYEPSADWGFASAIINAHF